MIRLVLLRVSGFPSVRMTGRKTITLKMAATNAGVFIATRSSTDTSAESSARSAGQSLFLRRTIKDIYPLRVSEETDMSEEPEKENQQATSSGLDDPPCSPDEFFRRLAQAQLTETDQKRLMYLVSNDGYACRAWHQLKAEYKRHFEENDQGYRPDNNT